jgi:hypothetical protein
MWFAYTNDFANWHVLKIEQVKEIVAENKLKNKVASLEDFAIVIVPETEKHFNNAMGQESLTRFDQPKKKKKPNKKRKTGDNLIVANKENSNNSVNNKSNNNRNTANNNNRKNNNPKPNLPSDKKPVTARKPIIITKNENKE